MKATLLFFFTFLSLSTYADLQLRTNFFYDPKSTNSGTGSSTSGGTIQGEEVSETTLTYRLDAFNRLPGGFKFGYAFGVMSISKDTTSGATNSSEESSVTFHGPAVGFGWSRFSLEFFYYFGARESKTENDGTTTTKSEYRDSSGYEVNFGYTYPIGRRVSVGARYSYRVLSQEEVGVKVGGASTETAYTLSEANSRTTSQILIAVDLRFF